ncbi:MAG: hypothetical protein Q8P53_00800 [Candidatus Shapirobacteria bacterium]|nr:hypothetical protein [Candidatus Shapirobacteria bacterium]
MSSENKKTPKPVTVVKPVVPVKPTFPSPPSGSNFKPNARFQSINRSRR